MANNEQTAQQLQQDIQQELVTANQLLQLISSELQTIKKFTNPGGEFEMNIKENASLMNKLAELQRIDLDNIPQVNRKVIDFNTNENLNQTSEEQNTYNELEMDESQ